MLKEKGIKIGSDQTIARRNGEGPSPLSFAQQRLWFLDHLDGESSTYNIPVAANLQGPLNVEALERSLNEIVRRHESLRTTFATEDGQPIQVITSDLRLPLPIVDLRGLSPEKKQSDIQRRVNEEAQRAFDLAKGPLLRAGLLKLDEQEHVMLLTIHHIVSDGWSIGILIREMGELYSAFSKDEPSPLPQLQIQYADYAVWQRQWLQGEALEAQLSYWKQHLSGAPRVLQLPTDRPRPAVQSYNGATLSFSLPQGLSESLSLLSKQQEGTLFMLLLAAFNVLLYRYSGQSDIIVGSVNANRHRPELEGLIGFFVNTQVTRTDLSSNPTFIQLIEQTRKNLLEAHANQHVPFEKIVDELHVERSLSHSPLFQVMLTLQNTPRTVLQLPEVTLSLLDINRATAKFDLTLSMVETADGVNGSFEYNTDLFDASTIERMAAHFQTLLESIVSNPARRISELAMLSEAERQQLLVEFNDTITPYPQDICLHQLFEQQVERTPDALALTFEDEHLTYAQLNARANQLAHYLQSQGVGLEDRVGVLLERSIEMVVALLAVLKAGAAYVPLDPAYPQERLAFMVEDARLSLLLTDSRLLSAISTPATALLCLDTEWDSSASSDSAVSDSRANLDCLVPPTALAYVIYTSGSTGQPKGAMNTHRAIVNRLLWMQDAYHLTSADTVLQKTPFSFDVSVWEFFWPLLTGARLCMAVPGGHQDAAYLSRVIRDEGITTIHFVPSMLGAFVQEAQVSECAGQLRRVICSGEALGVGLQERFFEQMEGVELHNLYGPTEAAVDVTSWECVRGAEQWTVPIGKPIANTQVYILDEGQELVAVGVSGEVYLGGEGLARGYLNRAELTAERFIPHPFSQRGGARLYRTGDVGRYRSDGNIEYLGRTDHQVKIRGFRIELGEIESVLCQHERVREAIVVAQEATAGQQRLVGYVVPANGEQAQPNLLRQYLAEKLPEHMIPSVFVELAELPLTPNGKVDRRALPSPDISQQRGTDGFVAPRTPIEVQLCAIWQQVLGLEQIGIHDNFFSLGGDSILSIQIVARANQAGLSLSPRLLFQHQSVAALAGVAGSAQEVRAEQGRVSGRVAMTPIQQWFFEQVEVERQHWNQSVMLESRHGEIERGALGEAVREVLEHHDALRMKFRESVEGWEQECVEIAGEPIPLTIVDLTTLQAAAQENAGEIDEAMLRDRIESAANQAQRSLSLENGQLMRVVLFECGQGQPPRLLIVIHHLVVDGVSWRALLEDLETAYEQARRGERVRLPPKTTSFKEWAEELAEYAQSTGVQQQSDYWQAAAESVSRLPRDFDASPDQTLDESAASSASVLVKLDKAETRALLQEVPSVYHTEINDVLLTTLAQSLCQWSERSSVLIELEGHGREEISTELDISRTVGWFTTLYPVRLELSESRSVGEDLKAVKEQLRGVPERGLGYGLLKYVGGDEETRQRLREVRAEVAFNYLGQLDNVVSEERMFRGGQESSGAEQDARGRRSHALIINASVQGGELVLGWSYSRKLHERETIERVAAEQVAKLRQVIEHCREEESGGYTPSDFPAAKLSQEDLDSFLASIS